MKQLEITKFKWSRKCGSRRQVTDNSDTLKKFCSAGIRIRGSIFSVSRPALPSIITEERLVKTLKKRNESMGMKPIDENHNTAALFLSVAVLKILNQLVLLTDCPSVVP